MLPSTVNSSTPNPGQTVTDTEALRLYYEDLLRTNPNHIQAVYYLAIWHLERQSYQQARRFFAHLSTLRADDVDVWLSLSVCGAFSDEFDESQQALQSARKLCKTQEADIRWKFCNALLNEKRRDFTAAMEGYTSCLNQSNSFYNFSTVDSSNKAAVEIDRMQKISFLKEVRGEVLLRIAILKKEMGQNDQAMQMCNSINSEPFNDTIKANALCLKGLLHEIRSEFPASEVVYRSVLQMKSGHATALERLGRVYLRYRETIPAAVQCFFKAVETNPANHVAWYLLGRCYMATSQYTDACEAYNRAINLNPNDAQIWCSLGVLYYAFGQYREALGMLSRALKLDPTMSDAWYNVGALYDMCDQSEDAQQAYAKAKEHGLADRFTKAGLGITAATNTTTATGNGGGGGNGTMTMNTPTAAPLLSSATSASSHRQPDSSYLSGGSGRIGSSDYHSNTNNNTGAMMSSSYSLNPINSSNNGSNGSVFSNPASSTLLSRVHPNTVAAFHPNSTSPATINQLSYTNPSMNNNNNTIGGGGGGNGYHNQQPSLSSQSYHHPPQAGTTTSHYLSQSHLQLSQPSHQISPQQSDYPNNNKHNNYNSTGSTTATTSGSGANLSLNHTSYPFYSTTSHSHTQPSSALGLNPLSHHHHTPSSPPSTA